MAARHPEISGRTLVAGVIGNPIEHSLSPLIHNAWFEALDMDWVYTAFPVVGDGGLAVKAMKSLGLEGLNVTMPHKRSAAGAADRLTGASVVLGVANTLYRRSGEILATSTDGDGLIDALTKDAGLDLTDLSVGVLGAGGAARSIIEALGRNKVSSISIINRTLERAELACELSSVARIGRIDEISEWDLIINSTSIGMNSLDSPLPVGVLSANQTVVDIIYEPSTTELLRQASSAGARPIGGLGMLVRQAAISFRLWTGESPPVDVAYRALARIGHET